MQSGLKRQLLKPPVFSQTDRGQDTRGHHRSLEASQQALTGTDSGGHKVTGAFRAFEKKFLFGHGVLPKDYPYVPDRQGMSGQMVSTCLS